MRPLGFEIGKMGVVMSRVTAADYIQDGLVAMWDGIENAGWGLHDTKSFPVNLITGESDIPFSAFVSTTISEKSLIITGDTTVVSVSEYDFGSTLPYLTAEFNISIKLVDATLSEHRVYIALGSTATASSLNLYPEKEKIIFCRGNNYFAYSEGAESGVANSGVYSIVASVDKSSDENYNIADYYKDGNLKHSVNKSNWVFGSYKIENPAEFRIKVSSGEELIIRNIRFYSRALTAEEVAYNYSIDRARFNLP